MCYACRKTTTIISVTSKFKITGEIKLCRCSSCQNDRYSTSGLSLQMEITIIVIDRIDTSSVPGICTCKPCNWCRMWQHLWYASGTRVCCQSEWNLNLVTRQLHEKWQDNMNLYENQRWNQVFRKGKHFLFRMRHPSWCPISCIKEWKALMTTMSWYTDVICHRGQWDAIRECQMMVTTKQLFKCRSMKPWLIIFLVNRTDRCWKSWIAVSRISNQLPHVNTICSKWRDVTVEKGIVDKRKIKREKKLT